MTTISKDNPQFFELTKYMWESNMITVDEMREFNPGRLVGFRR